MQCRNCGVPLPPGSPSCPNCGAATPYNVSSIPPTLYAQPSSNAANQYEGPPANPVNQYGGPPVNPANFYGAPPANPYGAPSNQYGGPSSNSANQYGGPSSNQYGAPSNSANPYGAPSANPYGPPQNGAYGNYAPSYPGYQPQMPPTPPRKSKMGLILGIIAAVVIVACIGTSVLALRNNPQAESHSTPAAASASQVTATSATTSITSTTSPSGTPVVPTAAAIISNPQTASAVNQDTAAPTTLAKSFKAGSYVYVTFDLDLTKANIDITTQKAYVEGRFYVDGNFGKSEILTIDRPAPGGYVGIQYLAAGNGAAELYWCTKADCSDRQLAQFVTFTITS